MSRIVSRTRSPTSSRTMLSTLLGHQTIRYGQAQTPFGQATIGWTDEGILILHLREDTDPETPEMMATKFPDTSLLQSNSEARTLLDQVFSVGTTSVPKPVLSGTPFQLKVWRALLDIPFGHVCSYGELATKLGHPGAARAVGTAVAANKLAYIVPCHRVVRASGASGQYRWGAERKAQILAWETHQLADSNADR